MNVKELEARIRYDLGDSIMKAIPQEVILSHLREGDRTMQMLSGYSRTYAQYQFSYSATEPWKVPIDPKFTDIILVTFDGQFLPPMSPNDLDRFTGGDVDNLGESFPEAYLHWNHQICLWPHPSGSYDGKYLGVWGILCDSTLSDPADVSSIPEAFHSAIADYASWKLSKDPKTEMMMRDRWTAMLREFTGYVHRTLPPTGKTEIG